MHSSSPDDAELTRPVPRGLRSWTRCPVCGGSVEARQSEPDAQPHLVCGGECGAQWWANPKPTASVLAEDAEGRLLLVRRGIEPFHGKWDTPGGFIEEGEGPLDAALRELREETGLEARLIGLLGVWPDTYGETHASTLNVFYRVLVPIPDGGLATSDVSELRWFHREEIPPLEEIAFDCVPRAITAWLVADDEDEDTDDD